MMNINAFICEDREIPLHYNLNQRAKRLSLRLALKEASFVLTIPPRATSYQIATFLKQCTPWIKNQLQNRSSPKVVKPGEEISLNGTVFQCITDPLRRKPALCKETQTLRLPSRFESKDLYDFFKKTAAEMLTPYIDKAARDLGQSFQKINIRDSKSRWGSCSSRKTISLSWRLILAPPEVAEYVCIHEVVHLLHMNHSKAFWKVVSDLCPAYQSHRKWLKHYSSSLLYV